MSIRACKRENFKIELKYLLLRYKICVCERVDRKTDIMQMLVSVLLPSLVYGCVQWRKTRHDDDEMFLNKLNDDKLFDSVFMCFGVENVITGPVILSQFIDLSYNNN